MGKFDLLLRDFGYAYYQGKRLGALVDLGTPGYRPPGVVGYFRSAMDACEHLCPIIADEEFTSRLKKYSQPTE